MNKHTSDLLNTLTTGDLFNGQLSLLALIYSL